MLLCFYHVIKLLKLGKPVEYSARSGKPLYGIVYSFTAAMNPATKESASLNKPVYFAGVIYHLGTFVALLLFLIYIAGWGTGEIVSRIAAYFLFFSAVFGIAMLLKRITDKVLFLISSFDDYISNILVTFFQVTAGLFLIFPFAEPVFMISAGLLLLYIPLGKLKHAIYFFAARYHIGYFYGWRNVWPERKYEVNGRNK